LKSSSEQLLRQVESASKKEQSLLQGDITKTRNELEAVQTKHANEVKALEKKASFSLAAASKGSARLLQEKIDLVFVEKNKEIKELMTENKEAMRKSTSVFEGEIASLKDANADATNKIKSMEIDHANEAKSLEKKAASTLASATDKMTKVLKEKIDTVLSGKDKELDKQKSESSKAMTLLEESIQSANKRMQTMQTEHKNTIEKLQSDNMSALSAAENEKSRLFQKEIERSNAENEKKVKELRSEFEAAIRLEKQASEKEMTALQDTIKTLNDKLENMQANQVKKLQDTDALSTVSNDKSRSEKRKFDAVIKEKNKELEELKSSSEQLIRQVESASKKEQSLLQGDITKARNELEAVQTKHANAVKALEKKASSSLATASKETARLLQEKIDLVLVEKNKEIKELMTANKEAIRQEKVASTKELKILQDAIEVANDSIKSTKADHANKVKWLEKKASSDLTALSNKSSQLLREKIGAVLSERDKELEKGKSDSTAILNDTIQKSNSKIKTILSKHGDQIKQLKDKSANKEFKELKSMCPTLFEKKVEDDSITIACKYLDPNNLQVGLYGQNTMTVQGGSQNGSLPEYPLIPRYNGADRFAVGASTVVIITVASILPFYFKGYRLLIMAPVRRLLRKTPLVINAARSFLFKPTRGIIGLSSAWLKGYLPM